MRVLMSETKQENLNNRGFWYERTADGRVWLCFKVRVNGQKFVQKLALPRGVSELETK